MTLADELRDANAAITKLVYALVMASGTGKTADELRAYAREYLRPIAEGMARQEFGS